MRFSKHLAIGALGSLLLPVAAEAETPFEAQVLTALNLVRTNPTAFSAKLEAFRTYFHGASYMVPGDHIRKSSSEGVAAVDKAILFLNGQPAAKAIASSSLLQAAAGDHAADQATNGTSGHTGADGSSPSDRVRRRGGGDYVAEVIEYGASDPLDVVRQLVIDDGVPDRGHRAILFDPRLKYAGVACGSHTRFRTMCVIDLGVSIDGRPDHIEIADAR